MVYRYSYDDAYSGPEPMPYRLHALQFASAARKLIDSSNHGEINGMAAIPIAYLLCHSMEMSLKLALMKNSFSVHDLKKLPIRHSLNDLLDECQKLKISFTEQERLAINSLSSAHSQHVLRYSAMTEGFWIPQTLRNV